MTRTGHLHREIIKIKKSILALGAEVEESVILAIRAARTSDKNMAKAVFERDNVIDMAEVDLEEECLKILALNQPVAIDLRFLIATLKMNNDLERIGDLAVNIAERALILARFGTLTLPEDLTKMAGKTKEMLSLSLDALVNLDSKAAETICRMDDEVDACQDTLYKQFRDQMEKEPSQIRSYICMLDITYFLERIADLATNIAEDVIYMVDGQIIRHKRLMPLS
ncbi:phosphate signaling complex protein PhoU [bacterium]|nr:phosphate signaling complex protein PhoU [bacterium]